MARITHAIRKDYSQRGEFVGEQIIVSSKAERRTITALISCSMERIDNRAFRLHYQIMPTNCQPCTYYDRLLGVRTCVIGSSHYFYDIMIEASQTLVIAMVAVK